MISSCGGSYAYKSGTIVRVTRDYGCNGNYVQYYQKVHPTIEWKSPYKMSHQDVNRMTDDVFKIFDDNHSNSLEGMEITNAILSVLNQFGTQYTTEGHLYALVRSADANGDGKVTKEEFDRMLIKHFC